MARRSHLKRGIPEEDRIEMVRNRFEMFISPQMRGFLEVEAKRLTTEKGKTVKPQDIVRALIAAYYEKRVAGLLVSPDD